MTIFSPPSLEARFTIATLLAFSTAFFLYKYHLHRRSSSPLHPPNPNPNPNSPNPNSPKPLKILFASQTGTSQSLALRLSSLLSSSGLSHLLIDPRHYDPEDLPTESTVIIIASTWENGDPPPNAMFLSRWLAESATDFRVGSLILSKCRFAVFGVGSGVYGMNFNAAARDFRRWMRDLGGKEMVVMGNGDVDGGEVEKEFDVWSEGVLRRLMEGEDELGDDVEDDDDDEVEEDGGKAEEDVVDLEDVAGKVAPRGREGEVVNGNGGGMKEMVTPIVRKNLEKQVMMLASCFLCFFFFGHLHGYHLMNSILHISHIKVKYYLDNNLP